MSLSLFFKVLMKGEYDFTKVIKRLTRAYSKFITFSKTKNSMFFIRELEEILTNN